MDSTVVEGALILVSVALFLSVALNVGLLYKNKIRKLVDVREIAGALQDLESRWGCLIEIRRVNPGDVFIWGQQR